MKKILLQGPMKGTYSLAIVNRNMAKNLRKWFDVQVLPDEIDCKDDPYFINDGLTPLVASNLNQKYDLHLKNTWPPTTDDMIGDVNAYVNFAWEETRFIPRFVEEFNSNLDFITVTSDFTAKSLLSSGVSIPVINTGNGVDSFIEAHSSHAYPNLPKEIHKYDFKFLHVSSGFWRKGVDILIDAFIQTFGGSSEACLIIKSFSNPDNIVQRELARVPDRLKSNIFVILEDIPLDDLRKLYNIADCIVLPSRGEGFSLPAAEAVVLGKPLITTRFSGALDFCDDDNSLLVDYDLIKSRTHVAPPGSLIANPDVNDLSDKLLRITSGDHVRPSSSNKDMTAKVFNWQRVARRTIYAAALARKKPLLPDIAVVTTWNQRCGLAEYSKNMINSLNEKGYSISIASQKVEASDVIRPDEPFVERFWSPSAKSNSIYRDFIAKNSAKNIILQHHLAYFSRETTSSFIRYCVALDVQAIIIAHNARDWRNFPADVKNSQKNVTIVVHSAEDQVHLVSQGFKDVHLFTHPIVESSREPFNVRTIGDDPHLVCFGFLVPHKGFQDVVHAVSLLKDKYANIRLTLLSASQGNIKSKTTYANLMDLVAYYNLEDNVRIDMTFLEASQVENIIRSADLAILPYHDSSEGASGALRTCITPGVPLLISDSGIFQSAPAGIVRFRSKDPIDLALKIGRCLSDVQYRARLSDVSKNVVASQSWNALIGEFEGLIKYRTKSGYYNLTAADQEIMRHAHMRTASND